MATYQIEWKASALHELKRIDQQVVPRLITAVESLANDPFPPGIRKIRGAEHTYRLRVGDYWILYEVHQNRVQILIVRVRHRRDVYRRRD